MHSLIKSERTRINKLGPNSYLNGEGFQAQGAQKKTAGASVLLVKVIDQVRVRRRAEVAGSAAVRQLECHVHRLQVLFQRGLVLVTSHADEADVAGDDGRILVQTGRLLDRIDGLVGRLDVRAPQSFGAETGETVHALVRLVLARQVHPHVPHHVQIRFAERLRTDGPTLRVLQPGRLG